MLNIVSLSDKSYVLNGLSLYESIQEYCSQPFTLHYLAFDEYTYNIFSKLENVIVYKLEDVQNDENYANLVKNCESHPIENDTGWSPYHWAFASLFTNFLAKNLTDVDSLMYCDSDIYFYRDITEVFDDAEGKSVGLMLHKHVAPEDKSTVGVYNIGIVYFKMNNVGKDCLNRWVKLVVDPTNPHYQLYGQCGDQRYVEFFEIWHPGEVHVFDWHIGNCAPWNYRLCEVDFGKKTMKWNPQECRHQPPGTPIKCPLYFTHFSHFTPNFINNTWKVDRNGEWGNCTTYVGAKAMCDNYFEVLKNTKKKYGIE